VQIKARLFQGRRGLRATIVPGGRRGGRFRCAFAVQIEQGAVEAEVAGVRRVIRLAESLALIWKRTRISIR